MHEDRCAEKAKLCHSELIEVCVCVCVLQVRFTGSRLQDRDLPVGNWSECQFLESALGKESGLGREGAEGQCRCSPDPGQPLGSCGLEASLELF